MEYLQEITLELNSNTAYTTVGAKQGDSISRVIKVHITQDGEDWRIPDGITASYRVRKPDGYAIWNEGIIDYTENVVNIILTEQTLASAGRAYADILFTQGIADQREVLSTVSFIIIIMAAPDVVQNIASSNEFARILDLTDNADVILNEAEAWAIGTKRGVPVIEDDFSFAVQGGNFVCDIDKITFREAVGQSPGYTRYFLFICEQDSETGNNFWNLKYDDGTILRNIDLDTYGISIESGTPYSTNIIRVVVTDSDIQYHNNAKYYAEQASSSAEYLANLTVSAEALQTGEPATVSKTIIDGHENFHFGLPKGDTGDVNFMTFDIDTNLNSPTCGELIMYRPEHLEALNVINFLIDENENSNEYGYLCVQIYPGGN